MNRKEKYSQDNTLSNISKPNLDNIIDGVVVQVEKNDIFIDIGVKSEACISSEEFDTLPNVGETVKVVPIGSLSDSNPLVSKRFADEAIFWKKIRDAYENRTTIHAKVIKNIRGGFQVLIHRNITGFVPSFKMDIVKNTDQSKYLNQEYEFHIERLPSPIYPDIHLSRYSVLVEAANKAKEFFFNQHKIGDLVTGIVTSITTFGAFVDIGGIDGLLRLEEMGWGQVVRPSSIVKKGEKITLKIIGLDRQKHHVKLSLRDLIDNPWITLGERYKIGDIVEGTVKKIVRFGAFVEIEPSIEGLVHISELSWNKHIKSPSEIVSVGQKLMFKILNYNIEKYQLTLGLKQMQNNLWNDMLNIYPIKSRVIGTICKILSNGLLVNLEDAIDGFIEVSEIFWGKSNKSLNDIFSIGERVDCIVLEIDERRQRIKLSMRQLKKNPWHWLRQIRTDGTPIEGIVKNITDFGVFVEVYDGIEGLVDRSNLVEQEGLAYERKIANMKIGDKIKVVVINVNEDRKRIALSVREIERREKVVELKKYIYDDSDAETSQIGDLLRSKEHLK